MRPYIAGQSLYNVIKKAVPDFVESDYPVFLEFVQAFLRFLEQERVLEATHVRPDYGQSGNTLVMTTATLGEAAYEARRLQEYRDVVTTLDEFRSHFMAMFAKNWPERANIPLDLFVHSLREFYQGKGTVETIEWFFRSVFGRPAEVHFPREEVFRVSDGTWDAPVTIKVGVPSYANGAARPNEDITTYYLGQRIVTPTGAAQVEKVTTTVYGQSYNLRILVNELTLKYDAIVGQFEYGQTVYNLDTDDPSQVVYTTILPVITGVVVESGGSNYAVGDSVTFSEGPGRGEGYGAAARVSRVSDSAISGVTVLSGGSGFTEGTPVSFVSSSGSGASAVIGKVIYGNIKTEDDGFLLVENRDTFALEDKNTIDLLLTIEPFVNAIATVTVDSLDYGLETDVPEMNGVDEYDALSVSLQAGDYAPFMVPWVFTGPTSVELANLGLTLAMTTNTWFTSASNIYALTNERDAITTFGSANITAHVITASHVSSLLRDSLYLKSVVNLASIAVGTRFKGTSSTLQKGTITTNGSTSVVGTGTFFYSHTPRNTHLLLQNGTQLVVANVRNNEFLTAYAPVPAAIANTWSTVPVGVVTGLEQQAQVNYGKIREIRMTSPGSNYEHPPAVTVDAVSARAQEVQYWDGTVIEDSLGQIYIFSPATLEAQQDAGQITRIEMTSSGVNYLDANAVVVIAWHSRGVTGREASGYPILGAVTRYPGRFLTTDSFVSADKVLQDSATYNDYTYQIRAGEPFERYGSILKKLLHPAGFKMLGQLVDVLELTQAEGAFYISCQSPEPQLHRSEPIVIVTPLV